MNQFDNDKDLNALDEMFLESLKKKENIDLNEDIKIDVATDKQADNLDDILIREYREIIPQKVKPQDISLPKKRKRGRPKGSIKKLNRKQVASEKLTISLSKEEKEILEKEAKRDHRSVSSFIKLKLIQAGVFVKK